MIFAMLPTAIILLLFFLYEQGLEYRDFRRPVAEFLRGIARNEQLSRLVLEDPATVRHEVWSLLIYWFYRYPQGVLSVIVVGMTGPRLVSYDLRSRAYLLYLSRPLTPLEYLIGKMAVLWFLLAMITAVPALLVYFAGLLLSPNLTAFFLTWDLPVRIVAVTAVTVLPLSAVCICYSSLTSESRFATFAWFATWILGWVSYGILTSGFLLRGRNSRFDIESLNHWRLVSPYHTLDFIQSWMFGLREFSSDLAIAMALVAAVTIVSIFVAHRRIANTLRK
jgi:ABC-2 type transport system permease protein